MFGDVFLKNLDIAEAEVLTERWKKAFPQMADDESAEQQQLAQAGQMIQAMQAQMAQMDEALKQKREKDSAEVQAEIAKTQADIKKTETETAKIAAEIAQLQMQGAGLTPEVMNEIVRTIAALEEGLNDTSTAVDAILSHEESKQAPVLPAQ